MNLKTRPLMIGAGAGAALLLVFSIVVQVGNYFIISGDPTDITATTGNPLSLVIACVSYICPAIVVIGAGYLYGHLASQDDLMETQDLAIGGAATGAATGIIYGVINTIIGIIVVQFLMGDIMSEAAAELGAAGSAGLTGIMAAGGLIGGLISSCCWLIVGAALGAAGGAIAGSMANRSKA